MGTGVFVAARSASAAPRAVLFTKAALIGLGLVVLGAAVLLRHADGPGLSADAVAERPTPVPTRAPGTADTGNARAAYGKLPLSFVPNAGQTDGRARFAAHTGAASFYFTPKAAVFVFGKGRKEHRKGLALRLGFLGANPNPVIEGRRRGPGTVNYLLGKDPSRWRSGLPTYGEVVYRELWPGIDMVFRGAAGRLKYEFLVRPGARASDIRLAYRGAHDVSMTAGGALAIRTALGTFRDQRPRSYQALGGRRVPVASSFLVGRAGAYGFEVGRYDRRRPLVIDPALLYSTYLGGSGEDSGFGIAVDASGSAYVTGYTESSDFPTTPGAFDPTAGDDQDAFVTKLNPTGTALVYSTYLGGSDDENGWGIAVDAAGSAYVSGSTDSDDFPITPGAFDTSRARQDVFVAKLNPAGTALVYSTYLGGEFQFSGTPLAGGTGHDEATGIAVDAAGNAYVTGRTESTDFPTTPGAFDTTPAFGCPGTGCSESQDAFVTKLNPTGTALVYSTYLGGRSEYDDGFGIAVDSVGNAYVTGRTESNDFPTTPGAFDTTRSGSGDVFVTKLDPAGAALIYSTYVSGGEFDFGLGISVDAAGAAYVAGYTESDDFPTTTGALDTSLGGSEDGFVTKLNPTGTALVYSTYLGGSAEGRDSVLEEVAASVDVDAAGNAHVTGSTNSTDLPTTSDAFDTTLGGGGDAFVTSLNPAGSALNFSTYLGGAMDTEDAGFDELGEIGFSIAVDGAGNAYVAGSTSATDFPTTPLAFDTTLGGAGSADAFVAAVGLPLPPPAPPPPPPAAEPAVCARLTLSRRTASAGVGTVLRVRVLRANGRPLAGVRVSARGAGARTAARTGPGGYARLALRPRRAGVITVRATGSNTCARRIVVARALKPARLAG